MSSSIDHSRGRGAPASRPAATSGVANAAPPGGSPRTIADRDAGAPGFTLLELLLVIAIIGIVAAISVPTLRGLKPNAKVAGTRELLTAVGRARQLAISQRSTVYMIFLPTNFFTTIATGTNWGRVQSLADKQLTGYAFVSLRSVGDQPGAHTPRFLSRWQTLPKGSYIPPGKFTAGLQITNNEGRSVAIPAFPVTNVFPFPSEGNPVTSSIWLPYIAFDGSGQLVSGPPGQPELIPLAEGSVVVPRDANTKLALAQPVQAREDPPGNINDNYSLVYIDRLTGRAHVERRKVQ